MEVGGAHAWWKKTVSIVSFEDSQLLFQFLTPHASDMLDPRNVVPYYEMKHYPTNNFGHLEPRTPVDS